LIALDSSALVAIVLVEPEAKDFARVIGRRRCLVGWPTIFETALVLRNRSEVSRASPFLDALLARPNVQALAFDGSLYRLAREAFENYGRGRHPAALNFGDCMAYAVAKAHDLPLLYKGDDFARTDIAAAHT
jgi:ribonuclease VapC